MSLEPSRVRVDRLHRFDGRISPGRVAVYLAVCAFMVLSAIVVTGHYPALAEMIEELVRRAVPPGPQGSLNFDGGGGGGVLL